MTIESGRKLILRLTKHMQGQYKSIWRGKEEGKFYRGKSVRNLDFMT